MAENKLEDEELEELLEKASSQEEAFVDIVPGTVKITKNAKKKAQSLGPLIANMGKSAYEWYGFVLGNVDDYIIRDIVLAKDQNVSSAHVSVDGVKVAQAAEEVKQINQDNNTDYQILGWIHNHGNFGTFHSGTDDDNIFTVLNSVSLNTERSTYKPFRLIETETNQTLEDDKIIIKGKNETDAVLEYELTDEKKLKKLLKKYDIKCPKKADLSSVAINLFNDMILASKLQVKEPKIVGFCYSVVVNNKGEEPHAEVAVIEQDAISNKKNLYKFKTSLDPVSVKNDIKVVEKDLKKEIKDNINFPKFWQFIREVGKQIGVYDYGDNSDYVVPTYGPVIPGHKRNVKITYAEKTKKKKTLKELIREFVDVAIDNVDDYDYQYSGAYALHVGKVLENILVNGTGLREAIEKAGILESPDESVKPPFKDILPEAIASVIYEKIDRKKDKTLKEFMLEYTDASSYNRSDVLEKYIPKLLKEAGIETPTVYKNRKPDYSEEEDIDDLLDEDKGEDLEEKKTNSQSSEMEIGARVRVKGDTGIHRSGDIGTIKDVSGASGSYVVFDDKLGSLEYFYNRNLELIETTNFKTKKGKKENLEEKSNIQYSGMEIGSKVRVRKDSQYEDLGVGTIGMINSNDKVSVRFGGAHYILGIKDLELVKEKTNSKTKKGKKEDLEEKSNTQYSEMKKDAIVRIKNGIYAGLIGVLEEDFEMLNGSHYPASVKFHDDGAGYYRHIKYFKFDLELIEPTNSKTKKGKKEDLEEKSNTQYSEMKKDAIVKIKSGVYEGFIGVLEEDFGKKDYSSASVKLYNDSMGYDMHIKYFRDELELVETTDSKTEETEIDDLLENNGGENS